MLLLMIAVALLGRARDHELLRQLYELRLGLPVGASLHFTSFMENGQAGAAVGVADIHVAHIHMPPGFLRIDQVPLMILAVGEDTGDSRQVAQEFEALGVAHAGALPYLIGDQGRAGGAVGGAVVFDPVADEEGQLPHFLPVRLTCQTVDEGLAVCRRLRVGFGVPQRGLRRDPGRADQ